MEINTIKNWKNIFIGFAMFTKCFHMNDLNNVDCTWIRIWKNCLILFSEKFSFSVLYFTTGNWSSEIIEFLLAELNLNTRIIYPQSSSICSTFLINKINWNSILAIIFYPRHYYNTNLTVEHFKFVGIPILLKGK